MAPALLAASWSWCRHKSSKNVVKEHFPVRLLMIASSVSGKKDTTSSAFLSSGRFALVSSSVYRCIRT